MNDHVDFSIGLLATFCGLQPLIVNEMEEGISWQTCDLKAPVGSPTGLDASGNCNITSSCDVSDGSVLLENGEICLAKSHASFKWCDFILK